MDLSLRWFLARTAPVAAALFLSLSAALSGDSNLDGRVSAADLTALVRILSDSSVAPNENADADRGGLLTSRDLDATSAIIFGDAPEAAPSTPTPTTTATTPPSTSTRTATLAPSPTPTPSPSTIPGA